MNSINTIAPGLLQSVRRLLGRAPTWRPFEPDGPLVEGSAIERWRKRMRKRQHLLRLMRSEPKLLADIGLTTEAAKLEIGKRVAEPKSHFDRPNVF